MCAACIWADGIAENVSVFIVIIVQWVWVKSICIFHQIEFIGAASAAYFIYPSPFCLFVFFSRFNAYNEFEHILCCIKTKKLNHKLMKTAHSMSWVCIEPHEHRFSFVSNAFQCRSAEHKWLNKTQTHSCCMCYLGHDRVHSVYIVAVSSFSIVSRSIKAYDEFEVLISQLMEIIENKYNQNRTYTHSE